MNEFEIIAQAVKQQTVTRQDVLVGSGDDCALLQVPEGQVLAVSIDTMVEGRHFTKATSPYHVGYKLLAVNLSDLAAMGATPAWATVALTLPKSDPKWTSEFLRGFDELQREFNVALVGGDLTRGPLTVTCQIHGFVDSNQRMLRSNAKVGDLIYVTGTLGDAAAALHVNNPPEALLNALQKPFPRVREAIAIKAWTNAAIDVSDGLLADLGHICTASGVGARLESDKIPLSAELRECVDEKTALQLACTGGDDYELCFTVSPENGVACSAALAKIQATCIGEIGAGNGVEVYNADERITFSGSGYRHF